MPKGLEARQVQDIFFPNHKQHTFHRINLEYLAPLQAMRRDNIYNLLNAGLRRNLLKVGSPEDILHSLRPQLENLASHVSSQGIRLLRGREHLRKQLLDASRGSLSLYRAGIEAEYASKKLSESLHAKDQSVEINVRLAEHMLKDALQINYTDYRAHFELGWIYLFMLNRLQKAEFHFDVAASQAQNRDKSFAIFALRHLADARYGLQDFSGAVEATLSALHEGQPDDLENVYECSRYLAASGDNELAVRKLAHAVTQSPLYYVQAQAEPDFKGNVDITNLLHDLRNLKLRRIQAYVQQNWRKRSISSFPLPDRINSGQLFEQVYQQHLRVLAHLPYVTLSQREKQIGDLIVEATQKRVLREVRQRSRHYENAVEKKRANWSWVNWMGGFLVHVSSVLLLASLMFYLLRFIADMLGLGSLLNADSIITPVLSSMLMLGTAGIFLLRFVPFGVKKLLRKQLELDNTLNLLQAS